MARPLDAPDLDPIRCYEAQTARLWRLTEFVGRFAPSVGERHEVSYTDQDNLLDKDATDATQPLDRDHAISAAFDAIAAIAKKSA